MMIVPALLVLEITDLTAVAGQQAFGELHFVRNMVGRFKGNLSPRGSAGGCMLLPVPTGKLGWLNLISGVTW